MPTTLMTRGTMNPAPGALDDQRAYQLALELSMLGINQQSHTHSHNNSHPHHSHRHHDFDPSHDFQDYIHPDTQYHPKNNHMLDQPHEDAVALAMARKSSNMTEAVPVPSSEHVAEIVGRQGCKIKALRAKTNTYIKTPVRGAEPVFVVTGRKEDVAQAKREIVSAAEHFSQIRASRRNGAPAPSSQGHSSGSSSPTSTPGHITIQVRVPYKVVGLVVGPKGATIKRIQQTTSTYIVTPGRDKEPVFEVTGLPDSVERAREEIEKHIASRTGTDNNSDLHIDDFQVNGIDSGFHDQSTDSNGPNFNGFPGVLNLHDNLPPLSSVTANNGHYSSGSTCNSTGAGLKISDYSNMPFSAFSTFDASDIDEGIGTSGPNIFDPAAIWGSDSSYHIQRSNSVSMSSRLPHSDEGPHPRTRRTNSDPLAAAFQRIEAAFSSSSPSSSQGSTSPVSGHRSPRSRGCLQCGGEVTAALVPCGHNSFCMSCAHNICQREDRRECPICHVSPTQAIMIHN